MNCPICDEPAIKTCTCRRKCMACRNKHEWHLCAVHNCIVLAPGTHSMRSAQCSCLINLSNHEKYIDYEVLKNSPFAFGIIEVSGMIPGERPPAPLTITVADHECQFGCKTCYEEFIEYSCGAN